MEVGDCNSIGSGSDCVYIDGKKIYEEENIPVVIDNNINYESFKDNLLANLYSTVEFLKNELMEKNALLKQELNEKNFLVRILLKRENIINDPILNSSCNSTLMETSSEAVNLINTAFNENSQVNNTEFNTDVFVDLNNGRYKSSESLLEDNNMIYEDDDVFNYSFDTNSKSEMLWNPEDINEDLRKQDISNKLREQLNELREIEHYKYLNNKTKNVTSEDALSDPHNNIKSSLIVSDVSPMLCNNNTSNDISINPINDQIVNSTHEWPPNTCLIVGDSILNNLDEKRLSKGNVTVKVRSFPGCTVEDMHYYIEPLLRKKPSQIILHVSTNDAPYKSSDDILTSILLLKSAISNQLPTATIIISQPTIRYDNSLAKVTIRNLNGKLRQLKIMMVDNSNIDVDQLSKKGLHLSKWGTSRLAMNFLSIMRQF